MGGEGSKKLRDVFALAQDHVTVLRGDVHVQQIGDFAFIFDSPAFDKGRGSHCTGCPGRPMDRGEKGRRRSSRQPAARRREPSKGIVSVAIADRLASRRTPAFEAAKARAAVGARGGLSWRHVLAVKDLPGLNVALQICSDAEVSPAHLQVERGGNGDQRA
eukprot:312339-Pleurochrysis_carterae.AAC.4